MKKKNKKKKFELLEFIIEAIILIQCLNIIIDDKDLVILIFLICIGIIIGAYFLFNNSIFLKLNKKLRINYNRKNNEKI